MLLIGKRHQRLDDFFTRTTSEKSGAGRYSISPKGFYSDRFLLHKASDFQSEYPGSIDCCYLETPPTAGRFFTRTTSEKSGCRSIFHFSERFLFGPVFIPNGFLFRKVVFPKGFYSERVLLRKFGIKTFRNKNHSEK